LASWALLVAAVAVVAPGCVGTALKEGAGVALGAKGTFLPIEPLAAAGEARPLGAYRRFELGELVDGIGGKVPPDLLGHLPEAFHKQLEEAKLPNEPDGKALVIRGTIIHYEDASVLGFLVGPLEQVIVRTELVDKDSGKVLGRANCVGRTTERINAGVRMKAQGLAKAFVKWIESGFPEDQKVK
jgi:hypothetical protein